MFWTSEPACVTLYDGVLHGSGYARHIPESIFFFFLILEARVVAYFIIGESKLVFCMHVGLEVIKEIGKARKLGSRR